MMPKLPLYEDEARLSRFIDSLIDEMKRGSFLYPEHLYVQAKDVFINEQLDADPERPPSKGMLAVMFYSTVQEGWDMLVEDMIDNFVGIFLAGDVRSYYTKAAPINDKGFTTILCNAEHEPIAAFNNDGAASFRAHVRGLNSKLSRP
jgi:hypothetical protein